MHNLIITEKPSVACTISKVLGATTRRDGYLEGGGYLISWCVGHLVELAPPGVYDPRLERWDRADLPILPERWQYLVSSSTKKQFDVLCKLMHRADVDRIVCATDAGREGELIFRLVYHQCGCRKPVSRLWISSMEDAAIRTGFANLKPSTEYDSLYKAALCRERADWLVGINATRLFSCLHGVTLNVGRVMTPTLAMTVEREAAIAAFKPEPFYIIQLQTGGCMASSERFKDKSQAEELLAECRKSSQALVQKSERKEKSEHPPDLYDLTTLQRDANRLLGYSAQQTLDYTQALYEKKFVTYPRTDSRYLTEDMAAGLPGLAMDTAVAFGFRGAIPVHAKQVINNQKVSDHHAILAETTVQFECAGQTFTAKGRTVLDEGWKAVERAILGDTAEKDKEKLGILPEVQGQETLPILDAQLKEGRTTPPKHFTEDTLLAAMESAGAETKVNCPNGAREGGLGRMPEEAERRGIGTPATRAATIEKLVQKGFLAREGGGKTKHLIPTEKGCALIAACNCVFCAADFIHYCQFGQPKGRQIFYNDVTVFIKLDVTLWCIIGARLDLGIRVGIGEVVFGNFLVILSTRNLFLKNHIVYFFGSKLTNFFLFSFLIHPVGLPFAGAAHLGGVGRIPAPAVHYRAGAQRLSAYVRPRPGDGKHGD